MTNQQVKYESSMINITHDYDRQAFVHFYSSDLQHFPRELKK